MVANVTCTGERAMVTDRLERARKSETDKRRWRKRALRICAAVVVGGAIGYICPLLPEDWQGYCHLAAKIIGFLIGGQ